MNIPERDKAIYNRMIITPAARQGKDSGPAGPAASFSALLGELAFKKDLPTTVQLPAPALDVQQARKLSLHLQNLLNANLSRIIEPADDDGYNRGSLSPLSSLLSPDGGDGKASTKRPELQNNDASSSAEYLSDIIKNAAESYNVDSLLIQSVIKAESNFQVRSTSSKGAMGLMQLMPATARELGVSDPYDPRENIMAGTRYLKGLLDRYHGDTALALAAYNWGMGNLENFPEKLPGETRLYIGRIMRYYRDFEAASSKVSPART